MRELSPYAVPIVIFLGSFCVAIVAILGGVYSQAEARRLKAEQRMAMLARGIPISEVEAVLRGSAQSEERELKHPMRSLGTARRTAVVLISIGCGLSVFFIALSLILKERDVLAGAAVGLVPLLIGLGFVVDYQLQKREMARFGLEVGS